MSHLADACALLAYLGGGGRDMTEAGRAAMRGSPYVSAITIWELAHKAAIGKLPPLPTEGGSFVRHLISSGFQIESFQARDAEMAAALPTLHKDPTDRMLVATAARLRFPVITCDTSFAAYGIEILW